ncbi:MFS transporter, partial [Priestia filamentosa]
SFSKAELGVVTSSSQFFRSIGGTFGITVLGAVMNAKSGTLLTNDLVPYLDTLPAQASTLVTKLKEMISTNPQGLLQSLFSPDTVKGMPGEIVPILKTSLMESLHSVFFVGFALIIVGALFTLFLKKIKLENKKGEASSEQEEGVPSASH